MSDADCIDIAITQGAATYRSGKIIKNYIILHNVIEGISNYDKYSYFYHMLLSHYRVQKTKMRSHAVGVTEIGCELGMWDKAVIKVIGILQSISKNNICFNQVEDGI